MDETRRYFERKYEELSLIAGCLRRAGLPRYPRPQTIKGITEEKFRLAAQLKSEHALNAWQNTETCWSAAALRAGPFTFHYRYQRADLAVSGPCPYRDMERVPELELYAAVYTSSGMAAVSALLLALAGTEHATLVHLPGCYRETLEFAADCVPALRCQSLEPGNPASPPERTILWLDAPPPLRGPLADELARVAGAADVIVLDTTCLNAASARIRRFLHWTRAAGTPVVLIRSHTKLDALGIEYGRLGSAVFIAFRDAPAHVRRRVAALAGKTDTVARLLGNKALPSQFCPFAGRPEYWALSRRRNAALLWNNRLVARTLVGRLGRVAVRNYPHGMFAALAPPYKLEEAGAAAEAGHLAANLASRSLPVKHAGSFGFDFVAIDGFFDTEIGRHVIRVAVGDLPSSIVAAVADQIASWWTARSSARAA